MPKTKEQKKEEIEEGNKEENVYSEEGREVLKEEEDEIKAEEEGFMKGYEEGEKMAICQTCRKVLADEVVERDFAGETYRFCSEQCVDKFVEKRKKKQ
jgi:hypothetical protein